MKTLLLLAASALALTACQRPATLATKLDCPQHQGGLTLVSAAADGQSCIYKESNGAEVTLTRMAVKGSATATLAALEAELKALGGAPTGASSAEKASAASAGASAEAARVEAEARADAKIDVAEDSEIDEAKDGRATIRATVEDNTDGSERTQVDLPGLHIRADGDKANVHVGPIHIDADGDNSTATIKMYRDVRLRGEALSRVKRGLRATFIYAGDDLSGGYKYLGYEAAGPKVGPITVAVVKSVTESRHTDMYDDVKKLVRRNGGT
ncbi:hypothetical protein [Phenylobacterium sp.]|uniref:hypothetical protein n=1 Tax=Phenylobacterium sp. TaxID=1871053 RepID=UPI0030F40ECA